MQARIADDGILYVQGNTFKGRYILSDAYKKVNGKWGYKFSCWVDTDFYTHLGRVQARHALKTIEHPMTRKYEDRPYSHPIQITPKHGPSNNNKFSTEDKLRILDKSILSKNPAQFRRAREWARELFLKCKTADEFVRRSGGCPRQWIKDFQKIHPNHTLVNPRGEGPRGEMAKWMRLLKS